MHSRLQPVEGLWSQGFVAEVLQLGLNFTVELNNGAPVSREGNNRFMQLLKESLQISSLVASYWSSMDAFTVAGDIGGPLELPWSCLNKKEAFCKLRPTV